MHPNVLVAGHWDQIKLAGVFTLARYFDLVTNTDCLIIPELFAEDLALAGVCVEL